MSYRTETISLKQERKGLVSLASHYVSEVTSSEGFTLVFAHSTSNHKEQWEIIVSNIFRLHPGLVNDAWAVDWQNHGQSAIVNQEMLKTQIVTLDDYADILRQLFESSYLTDRKVVGIGHSTGTCALLLGIFQVTLPISPVKAVILFEPVYVVPPLVINDERIRRGALNMKGVKLRKERFSSREDAAKWARKRMPWKTWDERMFDCYMEYGFRNVSPDSQEVTLNCTLEQEVEACTPNLPVLSGHLYSNLCSSYSVHGIFGERPEMYSNKTRDMFFDGNDGRIMSSVQIIPKSGHLLVQEYPDISAQMMVNALRKEKEKSGVVLGKL